MRRHELPIIIAGTGYTLVMAAVAVVAAWPVYASADYLVLAAAAIVGGLALVAASRVWAWPAWLLAAAAAGLFAVLGLTMAVATPWTADGGALGSVRDLVAGAVTGFKDLLTVDLPVGRYRNLLVPVLVVLLGGTITTSALAWRADAGSALAAVPALGMSLFGLLFGRTATSDPLRAGPLTIPAPVELGVGAAALIATVTWLAWRSHEQRRAALRRAAVMSGVRVSRRRVSHEVRRRALAAGMVAAAVIASAAVTPAIADSRTREVLRSGIGPQLQVSRAVSPLAQYRANFADAAVDEVLFRVAPVSGSLPERIRIATLTSYDGAVYRVADPSSGAADARFDRVPARINGGGINRGSGTSATARIEIGALTGIWLPTFGRLEHIEFAGAAASDLSDAFYYNAGTSSAVQTTPGGLRAGDAYTLTATVAPAVPLSSLTAPGVDPAVEVPDSVKTWIETQAAEDGGTGLQTLIDRLRQRGYLSHALRILDQEAAWMTTLGPGYAFQPSASGHSLARIDTLFTQLLERQTAATGEGAAASLVAAVGDDEQFAVAAALVAEQLGFPARIVVGVRLAGDDQGVPPCADGTCTRRNVSAWLEVASADGEWVPVDVTPQHDAGVDTAITPERDPEVPTDVRPEAAQEVLPPDPVQRDANRAPEPDDAGPDLSALWTGLRISGVVVLLLAIVAGPLLVIVAAKALRRRRRRTSTSATARVVGGWDEYVDAAVDCGLPPPRVETRTELARYYGTPHGAVLAAAADRAVFSGTAAAPGDAEEFWRTVDDERRRFSGSRSGWRRIAAAVSLKSFTRGIAPSLIRGHSGTPRRTERRGRRVAGGVR